jgi:very-short-patch-repair endonuclease
MLAIALALAMAWEPSVEEIEEKLIELAYAWGDIEEDLEHWAASSAHESDDYEALRRALLAEKVGKAFRVEAIYDENGFGDPCSLYVVLFDVTDALAREAARELDSTDNLADLRSLVIDRARPWHSRDNLAIKLVPPSTPVSGQICRRFLERHPARSEPDLSDVPTAKPESEVGLIERDGYWLTPIEVPFYEELRETALLFSVQPWIQTGDRRYRFDFAVFYDGNVVAVELDGHDYHKTKEQRGRDAKRDPWFAARKITTLRFTGSQVYADPQGCVKELLDVLRGSGARP